MATITSDEYIIYLRKSRQDNPSESVEEVLAKHEAELQEWAVKNLGGMIAEKNIYREIVSGETIEDRPRMQEVLALIENPGTRYVIVKEPSRLSRGDLTDCGRVVSSFRYTKTKVITPAMTYDLENKMERKFFEQELMRGNDFLEYTKEILWAGRVRAVKNGAYIGNTAPLGYDKAVIDDINSLKPNDRADDIRLIFDLYVNEGYTLLEVARHLDLLGIKPMRSDHWEKCSVKNVLKNEHYKGYVRFGRKKTVKVVQDGQIVKKRGVPQDPEDVIIAKGKHEALVSIETWDKAQEMMDEKGRATSNRWDAPLVNPLAGLFWCKKCGRSMKQHPYKRAQTRFECSQRAYCNTKSVKMSEVLDAVSFILENEKLPELEVKVKNNDGSALLLQKKQLEKLTSKLGELRAQEEKQYDLLEKGIYTEDKFIERNGLLLKEIEEVQTAIYNTRKNMPKEINYEEKVIRLKDAVKCLKDDTMSVEEKNKLLKRIIDRIEYEFVSWEGKGKITYKLHVFLLI